MHGFSGVVVVGVLTAFPAHGESYAAHPELRLEAVVSQQAAFLVRAAQIEIATVFSQTTDPARRADIRSLVRSAFGTQLSDATLAAWLEFMRHETGSGGRAEAPAQALTQAHRWLRARNQLREGPPLTRYALLPAWAARAEAMCAVDAPTVDLPVAMQVPLAVWRAGGRLGLQEQLTGGRSCGAFVSDLLEIVHPHANPMRPSHLEAFGPALNLTGLEALSGVETLNPALELVAAVGAVLPGESPIEILRLLGAASHNHAVELQVLEQVLVDVPLEQDAPRAAMHVLSNLNHLYTLLAKFYGNRFARPYHFHAAALVACELTTRGYPRLLTTLTGVMLGEIYEGASSSPDAEDVRLHRDGTLYGVEVCL